ncbi:MAG: WYL domain-containing protein [Firmicutes bacterium]|nr:WYL domain-containing protein [Bacillota bacterium]
MPYARTASHPEAMLKILMTIMEKTPSGGASLEDLKEAYREVKDRDPSDRTIRRMIRRINLFFDPLAYGAVPDPSEAEDLAWGRDDEEEEEEEVLPGSRAIEARMKNGRRVYVFSRDLTASSHVTPDLALWITLSLYPQQRSMLPKEFEVLMKFVFDAVLRGLAEFAKLRQEIERWVYVSGYGPQDPPRQVRLIKDVLHALRERKKVRLTYHRSSDGEIVRREVEPYGLVCRHNVWYLVGRCSDPGSGRQSRRIYRLDHIDSMEVLENTVYAIPEGFSLKKAYSGCWGVWTEDGDDDGKSPEKVRLWVASGLAHKFRVTRYHESQATKELPGGEMEVEFTVRDAGEMIPWLMTWGPCIRVLEPEWLRKALAENLEETLRQYVGAPDTPRERPRECESDR